MEKENNHYYPLLHIKNWLKQTNYKLFDKNINDNRTYKKQEDFTIKLYYSLGKEDSTLEDNLSKFEKYITYDQKNNLMLRSTTTTGEDDTYYHCELAYNGETQTSNLGLTFFVYDTDLNRLVDCVTFHNASTAGTRK